MLSVLLEQRKGEIYIDGEKRLGTPDKAFFNRIGVGSERPNVYKKLSGLDNLKFHATHYSRQSPSAVHLRRSPELFDRTKTSPVATVGGLVFTSFMLIICGFPIGLSIINDKEEGTVQAIRTSPASKVDYFVGKSIFPLLVLLAILGAILLPDRWHWVVWWSPLYRIYDILEERFRGNPPASA